MLAIIQARLSSKRLPYKVLKKLNGKPLIQHVIDRVSSSCQVDDLIIATSKNKDDDELVKFCTRHKVKFFRGSLENVSERMLQCAIDQGAMEFLRISGDSPLIDPQIINKVISLNKKGNFDITTNVFKRSFPKGQSVEIIKTLTLEKYLSKFSSEDKEHVTQYFYKNPNEFNIKNFKNSKDFSSIQLSIDTKFDFEIVNKLLSNEGDYLRWEEALLKLKYYI